ncbi:hypothetical protein LXL04_032402 [Taraxacum kok-saghyz]
MSRAPSRSEVRILVHSTVEEGQNREGSDNPPSFQHMAQRPPSVIQNLAIEDPNANPPSLNAVNPHPPTSGAEHQTIRDGTAANPPPSAGDLTRGDNI